MPIRNVFGVKNATEEKFLPQEDIDFQGRIKKIRENTDAIIQNANMVQIANNLLEKYSVEEIGKMLEADLENFVAPYDPAVIVALCQTLTEKKRVANKELN
ncbi:MAG: hypothetical protein PHT51_00680 [Patescibacteria group bacterium]|nr:hypothetical protein [Patescibacteria group bacterium]MDD4611236.1 hypothetical protein [Patescibacteria group bacterium]